MIERHSHHLFKETVFGAFDVRLSLSRQTIVTEPRDIPPTKLMLLLIALAARGELHRDIAVS